jgi:hypothetical protein
MTTATVETRNAEQRGERLKREERLFHALPTLGSAAYIEYVKAARRDQPPAGVLVRAYRRLFPSEASDVTLDRLADRHDPPGYIAAILSGARQRARKLGAYTVEDLVANAIGEIVATLDGPQGDIAERAWGLYVASCLEKAYRELVGRGGSRLGSHAAHSQNDEDVDAIDSGAADAWRARIESSQLEWLEPLIEVAISEIADDDIRAIGFDLFSDNPTAVSSSNPRDPNTLTGRFGVHRDTIYKWRDAARAAIYDALEQQNERDIDLSFLQFGR